ncbi:DUF3307 domain-containing protein [Lachnospiraceae bacterium LCP25S3_G4]
MFREYFNLLLLAHILGDFYTQTRKMAANKETSMKWVLIHGFCYWVVMLLLSLPIISLEIAFVATVTAAMHLIIDVLKFLYLSSMAKEKTLIVDRNVFFIDQSLHGIAIVGIAYWAVQSEICINEWNLVGKFFDVVGISETFVIAWMLALFIIHKPANIAIQKLLAIYKPAGNTGGENEINNAGRFIGTVERFIMIIFLSIGQYSAIGLVLTAKSIARYEKISTDKEFAEYYLLGTLISTLIVIICSFFI